MRDLTHKKCGKIVNMVAKTFSGIWLHNVTINLFIELSTPTRKRTSDGGSLLAKRRRIETPVRDLVNHMHPQVSPLVSVDAQNMSKMCVLKKKIFSVGRETC